MDSLGISFEIRVEFPEIANNANQDYTPYPQ